MRPCGISGVSWDHTGTGSRGGAENYLRRGGTTDVGVVASARKRAFTLDEITGAIIDASMKLHRDLGPGLLESVYEALLARELERRGFHVERQKVIRFEYDGLVFTQGLRVDLLVESRVVVELKSVEELARKHSMKVRTYIRLLELPVGLLINFGGETLREGLRRIVNNLDPSESSSLRVNRRVENTGPRPAPPPPRLM
jgi:iron complex transport system substrate-binding protein